MMMTICMNDGGGKSFFLSFVKSRIRQRKKKFSFFLTSLFPTTKKRGEKWLTGNQKKKKRVVDRDRADVFTVQGFKEGSSTPWDICLMQKMVDWEECQGNARQVLVPT